MDPLDYDGSSHLVNIVTNSSAHSTGSVEHHCEVWNVINYNDKYLTRVL